MKWLAIITLTSVLFTVGGCVQNPSGSDGNGDQERTPFSVAKSAAIERESSAAPAGQLEEQAESNNAFAVAMYKQFVSGDDNLFFSPYSITAALAMTAAGAEGNTKQQIRDALQVTLEGDVFDAAINGIDQSLMDYADATDGITLRVVNSTWMQTGWNFKISYLDHLSRYYGAGVNLMDFEAQPDDCREIINTWVADQTNQKIENLLPEGSILPETVLVLTNAIYFLGDWLYSFNPEHTDDLDFYLPDGSTVTAPMMRFAAPGEDVTMNYSRVGNARALDFPYKGDRLTMTVLLPDEDEFSSFESSLSLDVINELIAGLDSTSLRVSLPKFEFTFGTKSLVPALRALGMIDAFSPGIADFSGIDGTINLVVFDVYHKAFIAVDEEGTEAAAATAVIIGPTSVNPDLPVFIVNRSFIYLIRDKATGTILFMGRTVDPTVSQ
jgi:serpin B